MKKLLLSLGAVAAVAAPVAAVVACGADKAPTAPAKTHGSEGHKANTTPSAESENNGKGPTITDLATAKVAALKLIDERAEEQDKASFKVKINAFTTLAELKQFISDQDPKIGGDLGDAHLGVIVLPGEQGTATTHSDTGAIVTQKSKDAELQLGTSSYKEVQGYIDALPGILSSYKNDKDALINAIGQAAYDAIAQIQWTDKEALVKVNAIVAKFIEVEGSGIAFGQKNQHKSFVFTDEGKLIWTQVDVPAPGITYDSANGFIHRSTPAFTNAFETIQNKVLKVAQSHVDQYVAKFTPSYFDKLGLDFSGMKR